MSDEKPEGGALVTPEQLQKAIDDYLKNRHLDDAALAAEAQLAAEEAAQAAEVEDEALVQERTPEEQQAWRDAMMGVVQAQDADQSSPQVAALQVAAQVAAPQVAAPQAPPPCVQLAPLKIVPTYAATPPLDPAFARTYPPIVAPANIFDLKLRSDMFPPDSFFTDWFRLFTPTTDAPVVFQLVAAIVTLATAMGPRWKLMHCSGGLRPNVWFLMVADSGTRKSTVINIPRKIWRNDAFTCWEGPVESTRAFFDLATQDRPIGTPTNILWLFDEAVTFFSMLEKAHTKELAERLTSAYDGSKIIYTAHATVGAELAIDDPYFCILAGTPASALNDHGISEDVLRGGIFGRFLLVPGTTPKQLANPPPVDAAAFEELAQTVRALHAAQLQTHTTLSYEADQVYRTWFDARGNGGDLAASGSGIWNRAGDHALKLALIYHVAARRPATLPIQQDTMEQAITFLHQFLLPGHLWATVRLTEHLSPVRKAYRAILDYAGQPEGVLYGGLDKQLGILPESLPKYLAALSRAHLIEFWHWREDPGWQRGSSPVVITRDGMRPTRAGKVTRLLEAPRAVLKYMTHIGERPTEQELQQEQYEEEAMALRALYDEEQSRC